MKRLFAAGTVLVLLAFMPLQQKDVFTQLKQLNGNWKMETAKRTIHEDWTVTGEKEMSSKSYILRGTDTVILEKVKLMENAGGIFYVPAVADQNQGKPVPFKLVSAEQMKFVFENKEHDFPQRIIYHLVSKDSIHAWIEGVKNGKEGRSDYYFKRN
jgi:hypothetical protein